MTIYVFDKLTGKVVKESERTDRPRNKSAYVGKQFAGKGIRHPQLAKSPWDESPDAYFTSFKDLEQKAAAQGMSCNATRDEGREAHQGVAPLWNREK